MKVLRTQDFISERVKVKPVTNMEWNKFANDVNKVKNISFTKKSIKCGTIVMFKDDTLGVYVDGDIAYEMAKFFLFGQPAKEAPFYLSITDKISYKGAYMCTSQFNNDLTECEGNEFDIIRIYDNPLTIDELATLKTFDFYQYLEDFAESRKYTERQ